MSRLLGHVDTGSAQFGSVRLCLHRLGYHETAGGVNAVKWDNIITNTFFFFISFDTIFP